MKKILTGILFLTAVVCFFSCKNSSSPASVASAFTKALIEQDFTTAKKYATAESATILSQVETFSKQMEYPDSIKQLFKEAVFTTKNAKVTDTTATVDVTVTLKKEIMGMKEQTQTINLKKEKGEWKVDMAAMMPPQEAQMPSDAQMPADTSLQPLPTMPDSSEK